MVQTGATDGPTSSRYQVRLPRASTPHELRNLRNDRLEKSIRDRMSPANDGVHVHIDVIAGYIPCELTSRTLQWSLQYFGASAGSWLWLSAGSAGFVHNEEVVWFVEKFHWKVWDTDLSMGRKNMRYLVTNDRGVVLKRELK